MAIDFENRNPDDPNAVASIRPSTNKAWIKTDADGAWAPGSRLVKSDTSPGTGYREVRYATVTLNNGDTYEAVLDADGKPISEIGDKGEPDAAQQRAWKDRQTQANQAGKREKRTFTGTDPTTGRPAMVTEYEDGTFKYDEIKPTATQGQTPPGGKKDIEGTPTGQVDANGQPIYDNERPRWVIRDANGKEVWSEPVTGTDLDKWRESRERSRNPGGLTDAQIRQQQQEAEARAARPGTKISSRTETRNGQTVTVETWRMPDGRLEDRIDSKPVEVRAGQVIKGAGPNGEDMQAVADPQTGLVTYRPIPGAKPTDFSIPPNAPKYTPDYNQDDLGLTAYNEQLIQAQAAGVINRQQARQLIEQAGGLATQTASHGTTLRGQQATQRSQDITQRSQDIGEVASRRSFAGDGFDTLYTDFTGNAKHLGRGGGDDAARAFREALFMRQQYAASHGGFQDVPREPLSPAIQAVRTTRVLPDGSVEIQNPQTPSNAIGASSVGAVPAPGGPPAVSASAASTGASAPPAAPVVAPSSNTGQIGDPATQPPAINPVTGEPTGLTPLPVNGQFPINPAAGDPGHNPNVPVGQMPAYLQPLQASQWDPEPMRQQLLAQGFSPDVIDEAIQEELMGVA